MNKKFVFLILFSSLISASPSLADEYHNQQVLIGEKAAGMGGTFIAIGDGAEACYHNPAGLTQLKISYISVSSQVLEYKQIKQISLAGTEEKLPSLSFIPSFWGFAKDIGEYKFGFSIVVTDYDAFRMHKKYSNLSDGNITYGDIKVDIVNNVHTYLIGPSIAKELSPTLSFGATVYLRYIDIAERTYNFYKLNDATAEATVENNNENSGRGLGVYGILGILYKPAETLNIGLSYKTKSKSANIIDITRRYNQFGAALNSNVGEYLNKYLEKQIEYGTYTPHIIALGVKLGINKNLTLATDVTYNSSVNFTKEEYIYNPNQSVKDFQKIDKSIEKKAIVNLNLGTEYMLKSNIPFRFGFFTDRSTAPKVTENIKDMNGKISINQPSHIDNYGITMSSGILSPNSTIIFGIKYGWGTGRKVNIDLLSNENKINKVTTSNYAFNLSGSYNF